MTEDDIDDLERVTLGIATREEIKTALDAITVEAFFRMLELDRDCVLTIRALYYMRCRGQETSADIMQRIVTALRPSKDERERRERRELKMMQDVEIA